MKKNETTLKEHHQFQDFLYWNAVAAVPIVTACIAIFRISIVFLFVYILICVAAVFMVYKFYCTHCPHYMYGGNSTKCMFFWGVPKIFPSRPGPLNFLDKSVLIAAPAIFILFPIYWLIKAPGLLVIFILSLAILFATVRRYECRRCVYFECPSNCVPEEVKNGQEKKIPAGNNRG